MAGHSKWKNIRLHKGKADLERGKVFGRLSREITIAAKQGGNPDGNPRLRLAIEKARENSMPADNIKRAIQKGTGELEGANYEEVTYEGYGPGGAAVLVEAATDNRNRTATNVRTAFSKNGGNLGASGSVSHGFERLGLIEYGRDAGDADKVLEAAIEAGADDVQSDDDGHRIWTGIDGMHEVAKALEAALGDAQAVKLAWKPSTEVEVGADDAASLMKLIDTLEDDDDVQTVWGNYDISDEVAEGLA